jgi:hypothetical protein
MESEIDHKLETNLDEIEKIFTLISESYMSIIGRTDENDESVGKFKLKYEMSDFRHFFYLVDSMSFFKYFLLLWTNPLMMSNESALKDDPAKLHQFNSACS